MKINQSPNFQGINISKANVLGRNLDIYKLTEKDKEFMLSPLRFLCAPIADVLTVEVVTKIRTT